MAHRPRTTRDVRENAPYLFEEGDGKYPGSAILHGQIAAVSGVQDWYDEMFSYMIAAACRALSMHALRDGATADDATDVILPTTFDYLLRAS